MTRLAISAVLLVAAGAFAQDGGAAARAPAPAAKPAKDARPQLAVLYFDVDDKFGDLTPFRKGLAEMMITDLVENKQVRVVERSRLNEVLDELKLSQSGKIDPASAAKVGKLLSAQYQVMGSILVVGKQVHFMIRCIDVERGDVVLSARSVASQEDVMEAEGKLVADLQTKLAAHLKAQPPEAAKTQAPPGKLRFATAVKYGQAQDLKDKGEKKAAAAKLAEVVKEQPDFVLAQLDLLALTK